jgi:hypothetical protein
MALLPGNNLKEWIQALEPVTDWRELTAGTLVIHEDSTDLVPKYFVSWNRSRLGGGITPVISDAADLSDPHKDTSFGWFLFPEQPVVDEIRSRIAGKVRELGDGKWITHGIKERQ